MKNIVFILFVFCCVWHLPARGQITETNYLKADSALWMQFQSDADAIFACQRQMPNKRDSLKKVYAKLLDSVSRCNVELAIEYASVPSGLRRVYMVRMEVPKDTLASVLDRLSGDMRDSDYGRAIRQHIDTHQLVEGDCMVPFNCVTDKGDSFDWSILSGRHVLLLYGGMDCMGAGGRSYLETLYTGTEREKFLIVVYWPVSSPENLGKLRDTFPCDYIFVSDFKQDFSPMKIRYGTQATPTCFLVAPDGVIRVKSVGLSPERFDAELVHIMQNNVRE